MPNFALFSPVAMYLCVCGSTSGFTRSATGARVPTSRATSSSARSSPSDSTLNRRISALSASCISSRVLPTPEKMIFFGDTPARSARCSSPPETISAPAPALASVAITARLELALIE